MKRLWLLAVQGFLLLITAACLLGQASGSAAELSPGERLRGLVGDPVAVRLTLEADQYARLILSVDNSVLLTLRAPEGKDLARIELRPVDSVPISFISANRGTFELLLSGSSEGPPHEAGYSLEIQEVRRRGENDDARVAIERRLLEAESLASDWTQPSMEAAVAALRTGLSQARSIGDQRLETRVATSLGTILRYLGSNDEAVSILTEASTLANASGSLTEQIPLLGRLARIQGDLGEASLGREMARRCLEISEQVADDLGRAICNEEMAYVVSLIEPKEAVAFIDKALASWRAVGDRRGEARVLTDRGHIYAAVSQEELARESFTAGLALQEQLGDPEQLARALQGLAAHYSKLDQKDEALALYYRARDIAEQIFAPRMSAAILAGLGMLFLDGKEQDTAINYFREALDAFSRAGDFQAQGATLGLIGWAQLQTGAFGPALESLAQALPYFQQLGDLRNQAIALQFMGEAQIELGQTEQAVDSLNQALEILRQSGDLYSQFLTLFQFGMVHRRAGNLETALDYFTKALRFCQDAGYRHHEGQAQFRVAETLSDLGRIEEALEHIDSALEIAESVRSDFPGGFRTSYLASVHNLFNVYSDLLIESHLRDPSMQRDAQAFQISERARARSLLDSLGKAEIVISRGVDQTLQDQETDLRTRLNQLAEARLFLPADSKDEAQELDEQLSRLSAEYSHLDALIRTQSPRYASLMKPSILSLKEVQEELLDDETLLLEFQLGEKRSYLWAVGRSVFQLSILPARDEIETRVLGILRSLKARETRPGESTKDRRLRIRDAQRVYWEDAQALSNLLLGTLKARERFTRLLIVADGALHYLPFAALPVPGTGSAADPRPLILEHELVRLPSASILAALRDQPSVVTPPGKTLAVFADPVLQPDDPRLSNLSREEVKNGQVRATGGAADGEPDSRRFPRLPASSFEAEALVSLLEAGSYLKATGFEASRLAATGPGLRDFRIIHFATHGVLDPEHPGLSGIVLSMFDRDGEPVEGFLRLHDIYNLDLPAEMVVLSACESYLGKEFQGEGLVGLVRGFMYAGARRVVASLWKVEDLATKELMVQFYRGMFVDGKSPAAALRSAQLKMWESDEWNSPFFWASFIFQGDWVDGGNL